MKSYKEIFFRDSINTVITGDSISYNRYDYDTEPRVNAYDCYPGMPSWSFRLRDAIWQNDPDFIYGDELWGEGCLFPGNFSYNKDISPDYMLFGGRTATWRISDKEQDAGFYIKTDKPRIILYMQKRPAVSCVFDIYADGRLCAEGVDNNGAGGLYQGFEPFTIPIALDTDKEEHIIEFKNINKSSETAYITVAAVGALNRNVYLTGQGGTQIKFLTDNFHERIGGFSPDLLIFTSGANDAHHSDLKTYRAGLASFFERINALNPDMAVIAVFSTDMQNPDAPDSDETPFLNRKSLEPLSQALREVCANNNAFFFDTLRFFDKFPLKEWRFDSVHLNKYGNDLLYKSLSEMLF